MGAAAAIALFVFGPLAPGEDLVQQFAREARLAYRTYTGQNMPLDVYAQDDSQMQEWFNKQMGYPVSLRGMVDGTTQLLGGRLCRLADRKSVALKYNRKGVDLFLFAFQGDQLPLPKKGTFHVQHVAGRPPVAMWHRAGITYSLVGDLDRDDFLHMASTVSSR
jgi:anti-sigma factor RsiW